MPPKNSRRPAKKLSEFKKLQLELNPSRARDIEGKPLEPCIPECNHSCSSKCKHSDLPRAPINWTPEGPSDEKVATRFLALGAQMCDVAKRAFKEEPDEHGQKSLAPIDEFGNTILHLAAHEDSQSNQEVAFYCMLNGLKNKNPRNHEGLTPLHIIAQKGNLKIFEFILGCVKDKNPKDSHRRTPLHYAAREGHLSVCELIIKNITDTTL